MTDTSTTFSARAARDAHTPGPWRISDNRYGAIVSDHPTGRPGEDGATTEEGHYPGERETYTPSDSGCGSQAEAQGGEAA